jgi:hypothetical protein
MAVSTTITHLYRADRVGSLVTISSGANPSCGDPVTGGPVTGGPVTGGPVTTVIAVSFLPPYGDLLEC